MEGDQSVTVFFAGLAMHILAGVAALVVRASLLRNRLVIVLLIAGSAVAAVPAFGVLTGGAPLLARWPSALPGGDWVIGMDPLSAVFVLVMVLVGGACAVFGVGYMRGSNGSDRSPASHAAVAVLLVSLSVVVSAQSVVLFLVAWELMAIASFLLIMTDHTHADVRRAGIIYLVVTHTATLALFVMFALWTRASSDWTFASLAAAGTGTAWGQAALLGCALFAFGIKAGLVPAHFWLPPAHAAAPSHVSAIMSGLVIKTGIYGLMRVVLLAGPPPTWWGWTLLIAGAASALLGVLWALAQHDIKRLLAYHSVENIGIICMGLGLGALGTSYARPPIAVIGYGAALLHTVNHALFKSLLFLAAGAVQRATGTRHLEELGGLARRMPATWGAFAIGAVAIVGLPPLNGFVSEWLLFLGLLGAAPATNAVRLSVLGAPLLAVVGGLALACFTKVAGVAFLGTARSGGAAAAREVGIGLMAPTWTLAFACAAIGLFAGSAVAPILHVAGLFVGPGATVAVVGSAIDGARAVTAFAAVLIGVVALVAVLRARFLRRVVVRQGPTWACAFPAQTPRMQYTASSFANPIIRIFGGLAGVREHRGATVYHSSARDLVLDDLTLPAWRGIQRLALRLRPMQQGRLHVYLLYVIAALVALLAWLVLNMPAAS